MIPDSLRAWRVRVGAVVALIFAGLFVSTSGAAQKSAPDGNGATIEEIAQTLSAVLQKEHVRQVVIVDFVEVNGAPTPSAAWVRGPGLLKGGEPTAAVNFMGVVGKPTQFGVSLAERLSAAGGWGRIRVLDRNKLAAELSVLRVPGTNEFDPDKVKRLLRTENATVVTGSYAAAENGIGVTVACITWPKRPWSRKEWTTMRAKIELTEEIKKYLPGPQETLGPSDGIYSAGQGGVTLPWCSGADTGSVNGIGAVNGLPSWVSSFGPEFPVDFTMVVNADGHISDISPCKGEAESCRDAVEAPKRDGWKCKPALDIDGKPVSTRVPFEMIYWVDTAPRARGRR